MPDSGRRLGFLTYAGAGSLTDDDRLVLAPLRKLGYVVEPVIWDDYSPGAGEFSALVLRSTWDYHRKSIRFRTWLDEIEAAGCHLWNPVPLVRWNMDKTYLRELETARIPITPTAWIAQGERVNLAALLAQKGWQRAVMKPALSATAFATWTTTPASAGEDQAKLDEMSVRDGVLIQRYEESIAEGEWSLIFFPDGFSHSVLKKPAPGDFRVQKEYGGTSVPAPAPAPVVALAERVLTLVRFPWLYARVDLVDAVDGVRLMELEMLEPDLFLRHDQRAPERFARAMDEIILAHPASRYRSPSPMPQTRPPGSPHW